MVGRKYFASTRARGIIAARPPDSKWVAFVENANAPNRPSLHAPANPPHEPHKARSEDAESAPMEVRTSDVTDLLPTVADDGNVHNDEEAASSEEVYWDCREVNDTCADAIKASSAAEHVDEHIEDLCIGKAEYPIEDRVASPDHGSSGVNAQLVLYNASGKLQEMEEGLRPEKQKQHEEWVKMEAFAKRWSIGPRKVSTKEDTEDKKIIKLLSAVVKDMGEELEKVGLSKDKLRRMIEHQKEQQAAASMEMKGDAKKAFVYTVGGKRWYTSYVPDYTTDPASDHTKRQKKPCAWQLSCGRSEINAYFKQYPTFEFDPTRTCHLNSTFRALMSHLGFKPRSTERDNERKEFSAACAKDADTIMTARRSMHKYEDRTFEERKWYSWLSGKHTKFAEMYRESIKADKIIFEDERHLPQWPQPEEPEEYYSQTRRVIHTFDDRFIWTWWHFAVFVNIFDYIEYLRHPDEAPLPTIFNSEHELETYCHTADKFFSRSAAEETQLQRLLQLLIVDHEWLKAIRRAKGRKGHSRLIKGNQLS